VTGTGTVRLGRRDVPVFRAAGPPTPATAQRAVSALGLPRGHRPVVVLVGGADRLDTGDGVGWAALFRDGLVGGLARTRACLVDGGTDSGVVALAALAVGAGNEDLPVIGVVAEGTVCWPGQQRREDQAYLAPGHTHLVAVPGTRWGAESPWIPLVADALAGSAASVTVLINGGEIARDDARRSIAAGRPVLAVRGTGRVADELAAAPGSPLVMVVDGLAHPEQLADAMVAMLDQSSKPRQT
jgi:TRPM family ion channel